MEAIMGDPAKSASKVPPMLELRIHGIRNTPPHELLRSGKRSLKPDDVEQTVGDELAGFYRARPVPRTRAAVPAANGGSPRVVEAYSWGRLARFTGVGMAGKVADAAVRTAWFLLMPFGLTNAAYWSRPMPVLRLRQPQPESQPESQTADAPTPPAEIPHVILEYADAVPSNIQRWNGAGRIRLFALLLTLFFVVTLAVVTLDLIAVQCFPPDKRAYPDRVCSTLPGALDGLADWTRGQRIAVFALGPLLGLGFLAVVAHLGRTGFHSRPQLGTAGAGVLQQERATAVPKLPVLMIRTLWKARDDIRHNGWIHVWAAIATIAAVISWDGVWTRVNAKACGNLGSFFAGCLPQLPGTRLDPAAFALMAVWVAALLAILAAVVETVRSSSDNPEILSTPHANWIVPVCVLALAALAGALVASALPCPEGYSCNLGVEGRFLGLGTAPAGLMFAMLLLIVASFWPKRQGYTTTALGWGGRGVAVFSTLALGSATILSCAIVGGTSALLQGTLVRRAATDDGMWRFGPFAHDALMLPSVFEQFSGLLFVVIIVTAGVVLLAVLRAKKLMTAWNTPSQATDDLLVDSNTVPPLPDAELAGLKLVAARRFASLMHRAEAAVSLLATLLFAGIFAALLLGTFKEWWEPKATWLYGVIEGVGGLGLTAAGAALGILAVASAKKDARPLALLWDIMCFMPKAAHPFGPPCYAERAVPEFAARIAAWVDGDDAAKRAPGRVVISAHSLGAVIAVSALFHLRAMRPDFPFRQVGLMTYGTQLRAYFGRFFPELLGPAVLATTGVSRTGLGAAGGPASERQPVDGPSGPDYLNLSDVLGAGDKRWVNLYRRTDYLGFPIMWREQDTSEIYAQEMDPFTYQFLVVSHSDYLQAPQYDEAIAAVVSGLP